MLKPGEQIELVFKAPPLPDTLRRILLLKATGKYQRASNRFAASSGILPEFYEFSQNYPNPFNPSTTFSFSIPEMAHVSLEIFNVLGQKVVTLIDEPLFAGNHTITWDAGDNTGGRVASGVYFARFIADDFNSTKKMVVLK